MSQVDPLLDVSPIPDVVTFFAAGHPRTKGNVHAFLHKATGKVIRTDKNKKVRPWMGVVAHAAHQAGVPQYDAGVRLAVEFRFARPKSHYGTGRNEGVLKSSAPATPVSRNVGDVDKLLRAVFDALTGVAYADDSQICEVVATKRYLDDRAAAEGAQITVRRVR